VFFEKMRNADGVIRKITSKCELTYKKMVEDAKRMKLSNTFIDENIKNAVEEKQTSTQPDVMERNANIMRFFEKDMASKGLVAQNVRANRATSDSLYVAMFQRPHEVDDKRKIILESFSPC
jgi:hypothetical protein